MTGTATIDHDHDHAEGEHAEGEHEHASDLLYFKIAGVLAVMTAIEVAFPYMVKDGPLLVAPLLVMMVMKFVVIGSYFMHLKFDSKVLSRIFYLGLLLAVVVYVITLSTFTDGYNVLFGG